VGSLAVRYPGGNTGIRSPVEQQTKKKHLRKPLEAISRRGEGEGAVSSHQNVPQKKRFTFCAGPNFLYLLKFPHEEWSDEAKLGTVGGGVLNCTGWVEKRQKNKWLGGAKPEKGAQTVLGLGTDSMVFLQL